MPPVRERDDKYNSTNPGGGRREAALAAMAAEADAEMAKGRAAREESDRISRQLALILGGSSSSSSSGGDGDGDMGAGVEAAGAEARAKRCDLCCYDCDSGGV